MGKTEGKKPLGSSRRRWEDNIKMDLQEVGFGIMDWIELAQERDSWRTVVNVIMNLRIPFYAENIFTKLRTGELLMKDYAPWRNQEVSKCVRNKCSCTYDSYRCVLNGLAEAIKLNIFCVIFSLPLRLWLKKNCDIKREDR